MADPVPPPTPQQVQSYFQWLKQSASSFPSGLPSLRAMLHMSWSAVLTAVMGYFWTLLPPTNPPVIQPVPQTPPPAVTNPQPEQATPIVPAVKTVEEAPTQPVDAFAPVLAELRAELSALKAERDAKEAKRKADWQAYNDFGAKQNAEILKRNAEVTVPPVVPEPAKPAPAPAKPASETKAVPRPKTSYASVPQVRQQPYCPTGNCPLR